VSQESAESLQTTPAAEIGTTGGGQRAGMVVLNCPFQEVPEVVDRVQIRRARWPVHGENLLLPQMVVHHPGAVRRGVVVHECGTRSYGLQGGDDQRPHNLISGPCASQSTR
jgi:hypothetical protein